MKTLWTKILESFKKHTYLKWISLAVAVILVGTGIALPFLFKNNEAKNATKLSFKSASSYEYLKTLDGETVSINGYMATNSPVDGSFLFLMNLPYQSCPFCIPNTTQLSNTIEVYPKKGKPFKFTTQAIKIVGTLSVAPDVAQPFTDSYGYQFNYKIVNATYTVLRSEDLSEDLALWQKVAQSDIVNEIYTMFDYVNFLCGWNTYFVNNSISESGEFVPGYYLYPSDAQDLIYTDGAKYNYGYQPGYFESIVSKVESLDKTAFLDLISTVNQAKSLANKALRELQEKNYSFEYVYVEKFQNEDYVYTLDLGEELQAEKEKLYYDFSNWLTNWEM